MLRAVQAIRKAVIEAKISLSVDESAILNVELPGGNKYQRRIERAQFEALIQPVLDRTAAPCKRAMKDAGITPAEIDEVVLVGGSTADPESSLRLPMISST